MKTPTNSMQKHTSAIKEAYDSIINAYESETTVRETLNQKFSQVAVAINALQASDLFTKDEVNVLKDFNTSCWNNAYTECMKVSKESYVLHIKGE